MAPLSLCERDFMRKHLCQREGRKAGAWSVPCWRWLSRSPVPAHREAVLGHGDAAGLHRHAQALVDAPCEAERLLCPLTPVPRGAPATHEHSEHKNTHPEHRTHPKPPGRCSAAGPGNALHREQVLGTRLGPKGAGKYSVISKKTSHEYPMSNSCTGTQPRAANPMCWWCE